MVDYKGKLFKATEFMSKGYRTLYNGASAGQKHGFGKRNVKENNWNSKKTKQTLLRCLRRLVRH